MNRHLPVHEWIAVITIVSFILGLGIVSYLNTSKEYPIDEHLVVHNPSNQITIFVDGAVANPGPITVPEGTRLQDLKKNITLRPGADTRVLNKKRKLQDQETITVPYQEVR